MKKFTCIADVAKPAALVERALAFKHRPLCAAELGRGKTLGLLFMNPSLRTRMSTHKAAANLGMNVIVLNAGADAWTLEFADGSIMDGGASEHIKEAAGVLGEYCDIVGVRAFAGLQDRERDYSEFMLSALLKHCPRPIISLESATRHPLQSLADIVTIRECQGHKRPKVVLSWAPHPRALPQAVANSFAEWIGAADAELHIAHPEGFALAPEFMQHADAISTNQDEALRGADIVYAKNWAAYESYGSTAAERSDWQITSAKMALTNDAGFMHCLPVRRNVVVSDAVLDSPASVVIQQAGNRVHAAQAVLAAMLEGLL